jgi:hypothetical protein
MFSLLSSFEEYELLCGSSQIAWVAGRSKPDALGMYIRIGFVGFHAPLSFLCKSCKLALRPGSLYYRKLCFSKLTGSYSFVERGRINLTSKKYQFHGLSRDSDWAVAADAIGRSPGSPT